MANKPFNRTIINTRERPLSADMNQVATDADRAIRDVLMQFHTPRGAISPDGPGNPPSGGIGEAFKLRAATPATMTLAVKKGIGFFYDATTTSDINGIGNLNDLSLWKPAILNADQLVIVPAAPAAGSNRIDILELRINRVVTDPNSRDVLNPSTGVFEPNLVNKTLSWDYDGDYSTVAYNLPSTSALSLKTGLPVVSPGVPVAPVTTAGYFKLAEILVGGGMAAIDDDKILHLRPMLYPAGVCQVALRVKSPQPGFLSVMLDALNAPPGVIASAVWTGYAPLTSISADIYIISGTPSGIPIAYVSAGGQPSIVAIDAPMQAALAGVNANPPVKVAIGQLAVKVSVVMMYPGANDAYTTALVSLNG